MCFCNFVDAKSVIESSKDSVASDLPSSSLPHAVHHKQTIAAHLCYLFKPHNEFSDGRDTNDDKFLPLTLW